jgi:hypothetical protein
MEDETTSITSITSKYQMLFRQCGVFLEIRELYPEPSLHVIHQDMD